MWSLLSPVVRLALVLYSNIYTHKHTHLEQENQTLTSGDIIWYTTIARGNQKWYLKGLEHSDRLVFHRYPDTDTDIDTLLKIHTDTYTETDTQNPYRYRYQIPIPKIHTDTDN